jgi:hypothetical protein
LSRKPDLKRPLVWFVAAIIDATVFPLLMPWVFFAVGLIQGIRRSRQGGAGRAAVGTALNAIGLVAYFTASAGLAIAKGERAYLLIYLLVSPVELRLATYLHG